MKEEVKAVLAIGTAAYIYYAVLQGISAVYVIAPPFFVYLFYNLFFVERDTD